jgi:hypothetical protein
MTERMPPGLASRQMMTSKWTKRMARSRMLACYQNVQIALDLGKFRNSPWTGVIGRVVFGLLGLSAGPMTHFAPRSRDCDSCLREQLEIEAPSAFQGAAD